MMKGAEVESDKLFVTRLLQHSFAGYEKYSAMVAESVQGWEKDRLFSTDVILIVMGLAEAVNFPTIPVKVTINEYVELSKFYGTPKSRSFVNGLLDRLVQQLVNDGQIVKEGKGLL
jgi:N utilization substance protein B